MTPSRALGLLLVACGGFGKFHDVVVTDAATPLGPGRCTAETTLLWREPSPEDPPGGPIPDDVGFVTWPADPGPMKGWLMRPAGAAPAPVLVYLHGGLAWGPADVARVRPVVERGWVVFMPTVRGENGNPGAYELLCGEVDDAAAAVRWIAAQPGVDPQRVAVFGHSAGGALSALLATREDAPIAASGSAGGLYFDQLLSGWGPMLPYDMRDPAEHQRRLFLSHLAEMKRPHVAWIGRDDALTAVLPAARERIAAHAAPLEIVVVDGDHHTSLAAALTAFVDGTGWTPARATVPTRP